MTIIAIVDDDKGMFVASNIVIYWIVFDKGFFFLFN